MQWSNIHDEYEVVFEESVLPEDYAEATEVEDDGGGDDAEGGDATEVETIETASVEDPFERIAALIQPLTERLTALESKSAATAAEGDAEEGGSELEKLEARITKLVEAQEKAAESAAIQGVAKLDAEGEVVARALYAADPNPNKPPLPKWLANHKAKPSGAPQALRSYLDNRDKPEGSVSVATGESQVQDAKIRKIAKQVGYTLDDATFAVYKQSGLWKKHEKLLASKQTK